MVDQLRKTNSSANGKFLLTGSANILALPNLADALVGRMSVMTLYPFCVAENLSTKGDALEKLMALDFSHLNNELSFIDAIKMSTFPELLSMQPAQQSVWFDGYLNTLLQRDVRIFSDIEKIAILPNLLRILATRAGNLINDADIARGINLNPVTEKIYRTVLKMMFLTFDVAPWFRNIGKRLVKASKGYFIDTLLLCHVLDLNIADIQIKKPHLFVHIIENFVASELIKLLSFGDHRMQLFHLRTSDGKEVDFVLEKPDGSVLGIEVKTSEIINSNDFSGLQALAMAAQNDFIGGVVLYPGKDVVPFGKNLWAVPLSILWQ